MEGGREAYSLNWDLQFGLPLVAFLAFVYFLIGQHRLFGS